MKGRAEVLLLLCCLWPQRAPAQTPHDAVRGLAGRISAAAGGEAAVLTLHNQSSLDPAAFDELCRALEKELRAAGVALAGTGPAAIRVTAAESLRDYLLAAEIERAGRRTVEMAAWPRLPVPPRPAAGIATLEKKLVWEQDEPILDFALAESPAGALLLVLEPGRVAMYGASPGGWVLQRAFPAATPRPLPRDPRGRLTVQPPSFQAYLPGVTCRGTLDPAALNCSPGQTLWPLTSGASFAGMAAFHPARNYFEGVVVSPSGSRATAPPFFSMALAGPGPEPLWILAGAGGPAAPYTGTFSPAGPGIPGWGGDIAGAEARCGGGRQVLATRSGPASQPDALQAWEFSGARQPIPVSPPLDFPGPLTALWPAGAAAVSAVVRDPQTGRYAAYSVAVHCGS